MSNFACNITRLIGIGVLTSLSMFSTNGCVPKVCVPAGVEPVMVSAAIVQANEALFGQDWRVKHYGPGWGDKPAQVVFTLDPDVSNSKLRHLAHLIYELKGKTPSDQDKRLVARDVTDETYRPHHFLKVPYSISGSRDVYLSHIMVVRDNLLADHLRSDVLLKCNLYLVNGKPHTMTHIGEVWQ